MRIEGWRGREKKRERLIERTQMGRHRGNDCKNGMNHSTGKLRRE
jgi:hypothetical protein